MKEILADPHRRHLALTVLVGAGIAAYLAGSLESIGGFDLALVLSLAGGFPIFLASARSLARGKITADLAVSLAALAALWIGQYLVAAEVIFILLIGTALEHLAIGRTRSAIAALLELKPERARLRRGGEEVVVAVAEVEPGDTVVLRPGDRVPVDGRVLGGSSSIDQSPITGESLPADKAAGDEVFAGTINLQGALEVRVERVGKGTALERIIHLVEHAEAAKAPVQRLADRYAAWFVPAVLAAGFLTWLFTSDVTRAVAVLVVACPCALVLATPTAVAAGIGRLVLGGVLVRGGGVLETLGRVRAVLLDKTGTLTLARLRLSGIVAAAGRDEEAVLRAAATVERSSEHPLARAVVEEAREREIDPAPAEDFTAHPGLGAEGTVGGELVRVGSERYLQESGIELSSELRERIAERAPPGATLVLVAVGREAIGALAVEDTPRPEAREAVERLGGLGLDSIVMVTGDREESAGSVAEAVGITDVRSGLLPEAKAEAVRALQASGGPVVMVGDGINDAPSLVSADVGVAQADIGSDIAIASAGVVLVGGDLRKLPEAIALSRRVLRTIWQNIIGFAFAFNALAVVAAALGWIAPVAAAVVHQASSLTVVLNSLRLLVDLERWRDRVARLFEAARRRRRRLAVAGAAIILVLWGLEGLHVVGVGEVAVVQRFGRVAGAPEPPGLHWRLPWPLGRHTKVRPREARRVEVGFRTQPGGFSEPPAYEWNLQHRGGRALRRPEEATVLAGDENLVDVNLVVQYRAGDPVRALFGIGIPRAGDDPWERLVRAAAETSLRAEMARHGVDGLLASNRATLEGAVRDRLAEILKGCGSGLAVEAVRLGDVHPPLEVVPAYRDVTSAREEKEARINDAEAYAAETAALAGGAARQRVLEAEARAKERVESADGGASRFRDLAGAWKEDREEMRVRLWLEALEKLLAGRRKVVLDRPPPGARRRLLLGGGDLWRLLSPGSAGGGSGSASGRAGATSPPGAAPIGTPREGGGDR